MLTALSVHELRRSIDAQLIVPVEKLRARFPQTRIHSKAISGVSSEWISAAEDTSDAVILYFHGGGYVMGSPATHRRFALRLSWSSGLRVVTFDYGLAPENPFPAAIDDAVSVYRTLLEDKRGPSEIVLGGDSAGGGLMLATLLQIREQQLPAPIAAFAISPWTDQTLCNTSITRNRHYDCLLNRSLLHGWSEMYRGSQPAGHPLISPAKASLSGLPPLLVQVSSREILLDDATKICQRAKEHGVSAELEVWNHMVHAWHLFAHWLPEGKQATSRIGEFLRKHLRNTH